MLLSCGAARDTADGPAASFMLARSASFNPRPHITEDIQFASHLRLESLGVVTEASPRRARACDRRQRASSPCPTACPRRLRNARLDAERRRCVEDPRGRLAAAARWRRAIAAVTGTSVALAAGGRGLARRRSSRGASRRASCAVRRVHRRPRTRRVDHPVIGLSGRAHRHGRPPASPRLRRRAASSASSPSSGRSSAVTSTGASSSMSHCAARTAGLRRRCATPRPAAW